MKFTVSTCLLLFVFSCTAFCQLTASDNFEYEAGVSIGPMNSLTDLGGRLGNGKTGIKDLNVKVTTLYGGIYGSSTYKNIVGGRLEAVIGKVQSHDSLLASVKTSAYGRYTRNLSYRSPIQEIALTAEFHPIELLTGQESLLFSPYLVGGVGFFHFNPQANLNGKWIDLKPLHTEGQGFAEYPDRKEYKLYQFNFPYGIGVKYETAGRLNIRAEYVVRKLQTDYLDDVHDKYIDPALFSQYLSGDDLNNTLILNNRRRPDALPDQTTARPGGKRGNPFDNDAYLTINIKVGYVFGEARSGGGDRGFGPGGKVSRKAQLRQLKCPVRF